MGRVITESQFQEQVVDVARACHWLVHHDRRQDLSIGGDAGFPDLVLARKGRIVFAELKRAGERLSPTQEKWHSALSGLGAEVHVWRPDDLPAIVKLLSPRAK